MRFACLVLVLLVPALAHAEERRTFVSLGGSVGALGRSEGGPEGVTAEYDGEMYSDAYALVGPRITLSWEKSPLALPDAPGYRVGGALVPEVVAGSFVEEFRAEGYLGVGLRADLKIAQREQGLLKISARGALYLAARAMVVGSTHDPMYEVGFGEYLGRVSTNTRIGFEFDFVSRQHQIGSMETGYVEHEIGGLFQLYLGFSP